MASWIERFERIEFDSMLAFVPVPQVVQVLVVAEVEAAVVVAVEVAAVVVVVAFVT